MPNYTITRQTEPTDVYGCTNFQTSQFEDDVAVLGGGAGTVDGDIIWYIDANVGFTVNVNNFDIPNTVPTGVAQIPGSYRTFKGGDIPPPILGLVMEQITVTRIKVTSYLHPSAAHDIVGAVFNMPPNDVDAFLPIVGCADPQGNPVQILIQPNPVLVPTGNITPTTPTTTVVINPTHTSNITNQVVGNDHNLVTGVVPKTSSDEPVDDGDLMSYTVATDDGDRFVGEPTMTPTTADYNVTSTVTKDDSGNIISKTFSISKK